MLLALEARSPDDDDLLVAFRDFMFRWQFELQAGSVNCEWSIDVEGDMLRMAPHATLQVLRVAQESLTNVAKHANASRVELSLWSRRPAHRRRRRGHAVRQVAQRAEHAQHARAGAVAGGHARDRAG